jgi:hypothetical protein
MILPSQVTANLRPNNTVKIDKTPKITINCFKFQGNRNEDYRRVLHGVGDGYVEECTLDIISRG